MDMVQFKIGENCQGKGTPKLANVCASQDDPPTLQALSVSCRIKSRAIMKSRAGWRASNYEEAPSSNYLGKPLVSYKMGCDWTKGLQGRAKPWWFPWEPVSQLAQTLTSINAPTRLDRKPGLPDPVIAPECPIVPPEDENGKPTTYSGSTVTSSEAGAMKPWPSKTLCDQVIYLGPDTLKFFQLILHKQTFSPWRCGQTTDFYFELNLSSL